MCVSPSPFFLPSSAVCMCVRTMCTTSGQQCVCVFTPCVLPVASSLGRVHSDLMFVLLLSTLPWLRFNFYPPLSSQLTCFSSAFRLIALRCLPSSFLPLTFCLPSVFVPDSLLTYRCLLLSLAFFLTAYQWRFPVPPCCFL